MGVFFAVYTFRMQFLMGWDSPGKIHKAVIEKRDPGFHAVRHTDSVFYDKKTMQKGPKLKKEGPLEKVFGMTQLLLPYRGSLHNLCAGGRQANPRRYHNQSRRRPRGHHRLDQDEGRHRYKARAKYPHYRRNDKARQGLPQPHG